MKPRLLTPLPRCRWAAATALAVAVAGSPFVVAGAAHAAGTSEVDIFVRDSATWNPVQGQTVTLYSTATGAVVGSPRVSDAQGEVDFTGLDAGGYTAKVSASGTYREGYSTVVTVSDDEYVSQGVRLHAVTPSYGRLSGTVTKEHTDNLDADIEIFPATATDESIASGAVQPVASVRVGADGYDDDDVDADWDSNLAPGQYKVLVGDEDSLVTTTHPPEGSYDGDYGWSEHESQVWVGSGSANDADHARTFTISAAKATPVGEVALAPAATSTEPARISGTVSATSGGKVGDVHVVLFQQQEDETWRPIALTETASDGTFGFSETWDYDTDERSPIAAGVYTLEFVDTHQEYRSEFLGDVAAADSDYFSYPSDDVDTLVLDASGSKTADAVLSSIPIDLSSGVHGAVTDDTGKAHPGYVSLYDVYGNAAESLETRRDGTWSVPTSDLPPGQYRIAASDNNVDVDGWYGGKSFKTARTYTVPVKGAVDAGGSKLARFATLSGRVTLPAVGRTDTADALVRIFDESGDLYDVVEADRSGAWSSREVPGTYYVAAQGSRYDSFDETAFDLTVSRVQFIRQFWSGKYSLATATPIVVGSGATAANVNITLGRTLAATSAPSITGTAKAGSTLSATAGTWNVGRDVAFAYTWKRNGAVVGHASRYAVTTADQGTTLTLTVTATDTNLEFATGTASAKPVAVAKPAPVKHHKKKHHKKKKHKKHKK